MHESEKRGVKRKRTDSNDESNLATKLTGKLHHGLREARKAAKKAKTFETQKLVKKLKALRSNDGQAKDIADLEAQLEALKAIDHEQIAHSAVRSKLKKDRALSENEHVQAAIKSELSSKVLVPSASGTPASKVESRLLSSKTLAAEVHSVIDALRNVIQPKPKDSLHNETNSEMEEEEEHVPSRKIGKSSQQTVAEEDEGSHEEEEMQDGWEYGSAHEPEDDGWESGSIQDDAMSGDEDVSEASSDEGASPGQSFDHEDATSRRRPAASSAKKDAKTGVKLASPATDSKGKSKAAMGESTFLPSLSVGFTRGDSDASDWSDGEMDKVERKNRRGQRARRAIWEKKYGKNANHVKKEHAQAETDARKSSKKSRTESKSNSRQGRGSTSARTQFSAPASDKGWPRSQSTPQAPAADKQKDEKTLHPSWEAKRRLKEKLNPSIVPAAGKKIVF